MSAQVSSAVPSAAGPDANIWASGAATGAFEAFGSLDSFDVFGIDEALPVSVGELHDVDLPVVIDAGSAETVDRSAIVDEVFAVQDLPLGPVVDEAPVVDPVFDSGIAVWSESEGTIDTTSPDFDPFD